MTAALIEEVLVGLADPMRRRILDTLASRGGGTATTLAAELPVSRQAVVKHLAVLDRAGLVVGRRSGREVRYLVRPDRLAATANVAGVTPHRSAATPIRTALSSRIGRATPSRARIPTFASSCTARQNIEITAVSLGYRRPRSRPGPADPFWSLCAHPVIIVAEREILASSACVVSTVAGFHEAPVTPVGMNDFRKLRCPLPSTRPGA